MQADALTPLALIATVAVMRDYDTPITRVNSLSEMETAMSQELKRLRAAHNFKESGRAIFEQHLANYVLAYFFSQPAERRDEMVVEGRRVLEEKRVSPRPVYWEIEGAATDKDGAASPPPASRKASGHGPGPLVRPGDAPRRRKTRG